MNMLVLHQARAWHFAHRFFQLAFGGRVKQKKFYFWHRLAQTPAMFEFGSRRKKPGVRMSARTRAALFLAVLCFAGGALAAERIHFLIPGGAGGGWDATARGVGDVLARTGLVGAVSYENMSGGAGSQALAHLIETAERQADTLMISSSPIILRSLRSIYPQSFRDLSAVATVVADYGALVVRADSPFENWADVIEAFASDPRAVPIAGGSSIGSMDHVVAALAFLNSGTDPKRLRYIPYGAGGRAMVGLLSGETGMLSTGLSEAIALADQGEVRILATTAPADPARDAVWPSLASQGVDLVFVNWRGFFGPPGLSAERREEYRTLFARMFEREEWRRTLELRGWTQLDIGGGDFLEFLDRQEEEMRQLLRQLGMIR